MQGIASVSLVDNSDDILAELGDKVNLVLEQIGLVAEGNAVVNITEMGAVDTGNLRNSITHATDDTSAIIGTNVEYAPYVELGTYKMQARPFLKNAVANNVEQYKNIIESVLRG